MQELDQFKQDLDELRNSRTHIQIKLEEAVNKSKSIKSTLATMGFSTLAEAKDEYSRRLVDASTKHTRVKQLITQIKEVEATIPTKEDILQNLKAEAMTKKMESYLPLQSDQSQIYSEMPNL